MTEPMPDHDGHFEASGTIERLEQLAVGKTALIAGPGMGASGDTRQIVEWLIHSATPERPLLLDADALNVLAPIRQELMVPATAQLC